MYFCSKLMTMPQGPEIKITSKLTGDLNDSAKTRNEFYDFIKEIK